MAWTNWQKFQNGEGIGNTNIEPPQDLLFLFDDSIVKYILTCYCYKEGFHAANDNLLQLFIIHKNI